ncbi:MAG: alpha/beta hydrolase [Acidobacteriaceae bacterium]
MKPLLLTLCLLLLPTAQAQTPTPHFPWPPTSAHPQIPLWPGTPPNAQPTTSPERTWTDSTSLIAGRPVTGVDNVSIPTLTIYSPTTHNTGAAILVFPGGGYSMLAIDLEGTEVCDWLVTRGITCIVLKYRVPGVHMYAPPAYPHSGAYPETPIALEDAQRAMGILRLHAAQWHINPHKLGVLGFSAGGHLVAAISNHYQHRLYPLIDAADHQSCRPDFAIALYPGHLSLAGAQYDASLSPHKFLIHPPPNANELSLNPDLRPNAQTPPTFLLQAEDDHVDNVDDALAYYIALKNAHVPTELHLYAQGNHAFGLRHTNLPITDWPHLVNTWLTTIGMTPN